MESTCVSAGCSAAAGARGGVPRTVGETGRADEVGRVAKQELARHLVIQSDHERLDEPRVGLGQRDGLVWHANGVVSIRSCDTPRSASYIGCGNSGAAMTGSSTSRVSRGPLNAIVGT